jgi:hypothetical protein
MFSMAASARAVASAFFRAFTYLLSRAPSSSLLLSLLLSLLP